MDVHSVLPPRHGLSRGEFIALSSLITSTIAISIDTVLPAFDELEADYGLTSDDLSVSLTITVFFAALGIGTLVWGPFADRYGRKPIMYIALAGVILGAVLSSFAPTFEIFLVGRVLWGLAAAGPRTVVLAITRDSYEGDDMSRIMSLTLAVFLIVPILAPGFGELLLQFGSWRLTTLAAAALALIGGVWFMRIEETLEPDDALPLEFTRIRAATRAVLTTRSTMFFILASVMTYGSFFPWLTSSPKLIDDVYDRSDQFALIFGANALVMAIAIVVVERLVRRYSTFPVVRVQIAWLLVASLVYIVVSVRADGAPNFWVWFVMLTMLTAANSSSSPLFQSLAMQPMGSIAGTAASVIGAIVFTGGAFLGWLIDRSIDSSVTPLGVGYFVYGLVIAGAVAAAHGATSIESPATP